MIGVSKTGGRRGSNQYGPIGSSEARVKHLRQDPLLLDELAELPPDENLWEGLDVFSPQVARYWYAVGWDDPGEAMSWLRSGYSAVGARILANAGFPPPPDPVAETPNEVIDIERTKMAHLAWAKEEIESLRDEHVSQLSRGRHYDPTLDEYLMDALRAVEIESPTLAVSSLARVYQRLGRIPVNWRI